MTAAERMRRYRARRRAAGLRTITQRGAPAATWSDHRVAEARSLALHVLAARRYARDPRLLDRARATLQRWLAAQGEPAPKALLEWQKLLQAPWQEIAARSTALTEEGARLRQSSPLATLLPESQRQRVHEAFRA